MKKSNAWWEQNRYVECPHCDFVMNLGDQPVLDDHEDVCTKCKRKFVIGAETNKD